jgi:retron-type reverse transcriptase
VAECSAESLASAEQWMERICQRENLWQALKRVKRNGGSPGIDGMTVDELPGYLKQHWLEIREQLLSGTYQPQPVRRVEIPKPDGGVRKLGVPTVLDRMIQQAVMQVLQSSWDNTFSESSYGFRPGRSAHQAVARAQQHIAAGYRWVVDLDLEKFFDRVNHDRLMGQIARRVHDKRLLRLIRSWLKAGVLENGLVGPTDEGTPQGGPSTPLTQKVISSLNEQLRDGEADTPCLISVLRGNTFMAYEAFDQSGKGSAAKRCSWSAPASSCASRSSAAVVTRVRFVGASSISLPGGSLSARSSRRSSRDHGAGHVEAPAAHGGTAPPVREKQWSDHWSDCDRGLECVSTHPKKAWLSRVEKAAHFKSTFPIRLIACSSLSLRRPTIFWCPVASAPSACA